VSRRPKFAQVSAKTAIFEVLSGVKDDSYMTRAEIASMAKKLRNVEPEAIKTALEVELAGVFDVIMVPSDPRIAKIRPMARAYRWRS